MGFYAATVLCAAILNDLFEQDRIGLTTMTTMTVSGNARYDTRCYLTSNQKLASVSLIYRTEPTTKKWREKKQKKL